MAEKAKTPPRKRRKKGQFTVHILGQPPRHFYPEEFRDMPMAKSTICASLAATLPNNGQFLSAALQSCQELPQTAPNLEGVIVTDETACLVEESPMCGLNRQEDTVDVPETHCSNTLANLCDAECSDTQWDDNYDPAFQDVDIATPAFATDPIPSISSIRPSASTSHYDYATQLKELYYSRLMFLSTERYIQSLYFDLSSRLHIIAMLDFELEDGNLSIHPHPAKLRIVAIQATYFKNQEIGILRACDCTARSNQFRSVFLGQDFRSESLAPFAEESSSNDCIHSSVATRFLSDVREKHHDSSVVFESLQTPNQDPQKVDFLPDVYVTHDSRDRYFYSICYRKSKWRCLGCPNTTFCRHISYTRGMLVHDGEQNKNDTDQDNNSRVEIPDLPLEWEDRGCPEIQSITCRTYPILLDEAIRTKLNEGQARYYPINDMPQTFTHLALECPNCLQPTTAQSLNTILFGIDDVVDIIVADRWCSRCRKKYAYDGFDDGLFRHKTLLFTYELLSDAVDNLMDGITGISYWTRITKRYLFRGHNPEYVANWQNDLNIFQAAVWDFLRLHTIPENPCCDGMYITGDGTATGLKKTRIKRFTHPWVPDSTSPVVRSPNSLEREFFGRKGQKIRGLVLRLTISAREIASRMLRDRLRQNRRRSNNKNNSGLNLVELESLKQVLAQPDCEYKTLLPLLDLFPPVLDSTISGDNIGCYQPEANEDEEQSNSGADTDDDSGDLSDCQTVGEPQNNRASSASQVAADQNDEDRYIVAEENVSAFLRCLSADVAPLHQLMRPSVVSLIERYLHTHSLEPAEYDKISELCPILYKFMQAVKGRNNGFWAESLTPLLRRIIQKSQIPFNRSSGTHSTSFEYDFGTAYNEMYTTGCYFPGFKPRRKLQNYYVAESRRSGCGKKSYLGTFFIFCLKHKECLGFAPMLQGESAKTFFDIVFTRWENPPKVICYDNACNMLDYALNREPNFFKDTLFIIDGLHYSNHINCNATFDARVYREVADMVKVICEQKNIRIKQIRKSAFFYKDDTFMTMMSHLVFRMNLDEALRQN